MNYVVLDFEWNQPLSKMRLIREPVKLYGEIIQIGAVKLNDEFEKSDEIEINVKPCYYTIINEYVSKLTGITGELLESAKGFPEAIEDFLNWCGKDCVFITWGPDDMSVLRSNMKIHNLNPDIFPKSYNLQLIFNKQISGESRQWALSDAMEKLNLPLDLVSHDAKNDAEFTARICQALDMKKGIEEYVAPPIVPRKPKRDRYFIIEKFLVEKITDHNGILCKTVEYKNQEYKIIKRIKLKNRDKLAIIENDNERYLVVLRRENGFETNIKYTRLIYTYNERTEFFYKQQVNKMHDYNKKK